MVVIMMPINRFMFILWLKLATVVFYVLVGTIIAGRLVVFKGRSIIRGNTYADPAFSRDVLVIYFRRQQSRQTTGMWTIDRRKIDIDDDEKDFFHMA